MNRKPAVGARVKLNAFLGSTTAPEDCDPAENYWKLIGQFGKVQADVPGSDRVLIVFEIPVSSFGLHCHNPEPNSLRIQWTDLEPA